MYKYVGAPDWKKISVYDLAVWKNGLAFKDINFSSGGKPVIKISELKSGITSQTKFTRDEYDESVSVKRGDMVFAWSGSPSTSIDVFRWEGPDGWLNQHIYKITPHKTVDENFLFFILRWLRPRFVEIARNKQTTGLGHVTMQDFRGMLIGLPTKSEQRAIASFITPIQERINLNRRMNDTLEAMIQALFQDWFIDFGPIRAKMKNQQPYLNQEIWNIFPSKMDDERKPQGWQMGSLAQIADSPNRRSVDPFDVAADTPYIGLKHMPRRSIALAEWGDARKVKSKQTSFKKSEFLFGKICPDSHKVGFASLDGICSVDIIVVVPRKTHWSNLVLALLFSDKFVNYTSRFSTGTIMPRTSWKTMGQYSFCIPSDQVAQVFQSLTQPLLDRIEANIHENRTLSQIRDLLLPKLMSGEIRLANVKKRVEDCT